MSAPHALSAHAAGPVPARIPPVKAASLETTPMEIPTMLRPIAAPDRLNREVVQYRIILGATYPLFLAAAVLQRLRPGPFRSGSAQPRRTVFGEARALAAQAVPFAFMG